MCESAGVGAKRANFCCWLAIHQRVGQQAGVYSIRLRASILHFNCEALSGESGSRVYICMSVGGGPIRECSQSFDGDMQIAPQILPPLVRAPTF